jgi:hypothetical protein
MVAKSVAGYIVMFDKSTLLVMLATMLAPFVGVGAYLVLQTF